MDSVRYPLLVEQSQSVRANLDHPWETTGHNEVGDREDGDD
jgi:hypothetical protein